MKRKLFALLLATLLALGTTFCFAGCGGGNGSASAPSDPSAPSSPSSPSDTDPDDKDDDPYSQYSGILQTVLKSSYYNGLIDEYVSNKYRYSNKYAPIPFKFLQSQGHNIEEYKNDTLQCLCSAYVNENDKSRLYLSVKAENEYAGAKYYTNYILSYPLTEKEYDDLYMLHWRGYRQASYFIQELDNQKTAKIESSINVEVDTYERLVSYVNKSKTVTEVYPKYTSVILDVIDVDVPNLYMSVNIRSNNSNQIGEMIHKTELRELKIYFYSTCGLKDNSRYIKMIHVEDTKSCNTKEFQENYTPLICFRSQLKSSNFNDLYLELTKK